MRKTVKDESVLTRPGLEHVENKHHLRLVLRLMSWESWCAEI